jgi:hypothetical protein
MHSSTGVLAKLSSIFKFIEFFLLDFRWCYSLICVYKHF